LNRSEMKILLNISLKNKNLNGSRTVQTSKRRIKPKSASW